MEDLNMPPITASTSIPTTTVNPAFNHQQDPRNFYNQEQFGRLYAQNDQLHPFNEAQYFSFGSYVPQIQSHHPPSYVFQSNNQILQPPNPYIPEQVQMAYPEFPHLEDGSGLGTAMLDPNLMGFSNMVQTNGPAGDIAQSACFQQPLGLSELEEQRKLHSMTCKAARSKRKLARQMSASLQISSTGSCYSSSSSSSARALLTQGKHVASQKISNNNHEDLYCFSTPYSTKLRSLLKKELTTSDVGNLGRIILPKREAEERLPTLVFKEGIPVVIRDVLSNQEWPMRYRFWANHKGRMYILDQFGDFVKQNGMDPGDHLTLYEDRSKNLYFSVTKAEKPAATPTPSNEQNDEQQASAYYTHIRTPFCKEAMEEEDSSLKILVEELKHPGPHEANSLMNLYSDDFFNQNS